MADVAPAKLETQFFPGVSTNNYLADATQVSMFLPDVVLSQAAANPVLQQGAWAYYSNLTPDEENLIFGSYEFNATEVSTKVNLLPPIIEDPYEKYTELGKFGTEEQVEKLKLLIQQTVGADQLNYTLKRGFARQLLETFTGSEILPDAVNLTGYTPTIYSQGILPNSYAHSMSHIVNISRTMSSLTNNNTTSLEDALTVAAGILPSRMHMSYNAARIRYSLPSFSPNSAIGDFTFSPVTFGYIPVYGFANLGATTEAPQNPQALDLTVPGGAFSYPAAANIREFSPVVPQQQVQSLLGELWQKSGQAFDGYITATATTLTPDLKGLQWRSISDPSLQTDKRARLSSKRLKKQIHRHLARGIPLTIQVNVYDSWRRVVEATPKDPVIPVPLANEETIGSHFFTIAGYTDSHYVVINSMGPNVGDGGNFLLPKEYVDFEQDCKAGTGTFLITSTCWTSHAANIDKCAPTTQGCDTNQSPFFSWRSLFT